MCFYQYCYYKFTNVRFQPEKDYNNGMDAELNMLLQKVATTRTVLEKENIYKDYRR